jgi:hypothetical protein
MTYNNCQLLLEQNENPHLQKLHGHMACAFIIPQSIAIKSVNLHSLHANGYLRLWQLPCG